MKNKKIIIIGGVLVAIIIVLIVFNSSFKVKSDKGKETISPEMRVIERKIYASGTIDPNKEVEIKSQISGIIEEIYVNTGQLVKKGDRLVKVGIVPDPQNVSNAESSLKIARINLQEARRDYDRQKALFEKGIISEVEFNTVQTRYNLRQEEVESAQNTLQLLKKGVAQNINKTSNIIYTTVDGTVLSINAKEGGSVTGRSTFQEGSTVMIIADLNNMIFRGSVGESDVDKLTLGQELILTLGAINDEKIKAELGFIAPKGVANESGGGVKFDIQASVLQHSTHRIRAGYSANAEMVIERTDSVLALQERDITFRNDSAFVNIMKNDEITEQYIVTGISDGIYTEIKEGISKDDEIVPKGRMLGPDVKISFKGK